LLQPLIHFNSHYFALMLVIAGTAQGIRWLRWRPWTTLGIPLLWSLHCAILFIWLGLLILAFSYLKSAVAVKHAWHLLTIGGIGGIILAMIARVSLGHTGRPLTPPKMMSLGFIMVFLSALLRVFGPLINPSQTLLFFDLSGLCWLLAFAIFTIKYGPMLCSKRVDNRPG
jgi:uncharacterized protein involved in response to NO